MNSFTMCPKHIDGNFIKGTGTLKTKSSVLISHKGFIVRTITHHSLLKQLYKD